MRGVLDGVGGCLVSTIDMLGFLRPDSVGVGVLGVVRRLLGDLDGERPEPPKCEPEVDEVDVDGSGGVWEAEEVELGDGCGDGRAGSRLVGLLAEMVALERQRP